MEKCALKSRDTNRTSLGQNKDFLRAYHYDSYGIDQFIMIDPHGNIIQTHAPKPSSEEFKNLLQSLSKI
mgnify:CR=1 FL=1